MEGGPSRRLGDGSEGKGSQARAPYPVPDRSESGRELLLQRRTRREKKPREKGENSRERRDGCTQTGNTWASPAARPEALPGEQTARQGHDRSAQRPRHPTRAPAGSTCTLTSRLGATSGKTKLEDGDSGVP